MKQEINTYNVNLIEKNKLNLKSSFLIGYA